jgi:hypothetical protein
MNREANTFESCDKCGAKFADERALKNHHRRLQGKCMGAWYVCKRCTRFFDRPSELDRHQATKIPCTLHVTTPVVASASPVGPPPEVAAWIRYEKAIWDAGSAKLYLQRAIRRRDESEINNILEACSLQDLQMFLDLFSQEIDDTARIKVLAQMSNFANQNNVSLEKRTLIRHFVDENVSLSY